MNRNGLTLALAALFAIGAIVSALKHEWIGAGLATIVAILALAVAYRRGSRTNA